VPSRSEGSEHGRQPDKLPTDPERRLARHWSFQRDFDLSDQAPRLIPVAAAVKMQAKGTGMVPFPLCVG
jgi:hypothetical protein